MTTLSSQLKTSIEHWVENLRRTSQLGALTKSGKLPPRALAFYLEGLRHLWQKSPLNLQLAARKSRELGLTELEEYFELKVREEKGHDMWAVDDLSRLPHAASDGVQQSASIVRLVELQRALIAEHPVCFVAYVLWAEYFTMLLGDEWIAALGASGYAPDQLSGIVKHVDADREHAPHGSTEIDRLWLGQPDRHAMLQVVERASRIFEDFCAEICNEAQRAA